MLALRKNAASWAEAMFQDNFGAPSASDASRHNPTYQLGGYWQLSISPDPWLIPTTISE
jgi:hypothetical protein